jgi:two-component system CheB/CheR fusion protein
MADHEPSFPNSTRPRVPVVGIGGSAGAIAALRELFGALPADLGVAYVVVVHLAPDHDSELAPILRRSTSMDVLEVSNEHPQELAPDRVYVISPDRQLRLRDHGIASAPFADVGARRASIDVFFRSLAVCQGDAYAVILSGGGSDGVLGARAVKEAGGLVFVQDPREAVHDGMPRAVIAAELGDVVLPVRELAARLTNLARQRLALATWDPGDSQAAIGEDDETTLKRIFDLVRSRTGHDFSRYKRATIMRRLARRMQLSHRPGLDPYLQYLRATPEEVHLLFDDLLISVTSFFRDPVSWEALRTRVIAPLVAGADTGQPIRAWVPACCTGEEAYTLAMLFREEIGRRDEHRDLVIFGSDVDPGALAVAREGLYPAAIAADVTQARLARFFRAEGDHYRVTSEIRDLVVFAAHSVLRDPPFSRLDLISCRNLLIYLDRELQRQANSVFHYGLREQGFLFIGISETADAELFDSVDKQNRIFQARRRLPAPPVRLPHLPSIPQLPPTSERTTADRTARQRRSGIELHLEALEECAPPSVLIDEHWHLEHLSATAGRFLQQRGGEPSSSLNDLVRPELADELRATLHQAFESREPCLSAFVSVRFNGTPQQVAILAQPRGRRDERVAQMLVTFLEGGRVAAGAPEAVDRDDSSDAIVLTLRDKLRIAEQRLESMRQEYAGAYEDLRAANEELQSLNEEYRSTTEELETSKEELQSVNEELQTVNHELKMKLEEVSRAHSDLENFMAATDIPMLFLDRNLCIKRYTDALRQIFNVKPHDQGRPIGDLTHALDYDGLERDAARVLADLTPLEHPVQARDGGMLRVRIRPYRTAADKIDGVVVTFLR